MPLCPVAVARLAPTELRALKPAAVRIALPRRTAGRPEELWLKSAYLPSYAQSTFHYQTDGWQSQRSAQIYESSTETLFLGRQDAMQRSTLVHMASFMAGARWQPSPGLQGTVQRS